jgi:hypothetical protein
MSTRKLMTKKNKKMIMRGGLNKTQKSPEGERRSFFETIGTAAKDAISKTTNFIGDKGARLFGYKRINPEDESNQQSSAELSQKTAELASTASNIVSGVANKANQVGAIVVDELNKNIEGPVKDTVINALGRTVDATKNVLSVANEKLNNPEFVEEVAEATKNASKTAAIILEAAEPAINEAIDKGAEIGSKVASKVGESAVTIALNTAEAIPGAGALIGLARDADKLATAGEAIVEAGAETITTFSDTFSKAEKAIKEKMAETSAVTNRISDGINKFNQVDNISKNIGAGSLPKNMIRNATTNAFKKRYGGKPSRKFRRTQNRLSRRLRFKSPVASFSM